MIALKIIAWLIASAWIWKAFTAARGLPCIPNLLDLKFDTMPEGEPAVTVVIAARDEQDALPACITSLLNQDYPNLRIIAVNDRSTDATGPILDHAAGEFPGRFQAFRVKELPSGWLGKPHALALAARHAIAIDPPDYLLFTDADVIFRRDAIRRSLVQAVASEADHFVTFPTPLVKSFGEGILLSYLGVMGLWATRPWRASDPQATRDSIGIGAFNLLRKEAYLQIGGFDALRMEILEDLTLAHRIKIAGLKQEVAIAPGLVSLHWAAGTFGLVNVMTKNLFAVFRFRLALVLLACVGLSVLCLAPFVFLLLPATRVPAAITLVGIIWLYALSARHSKISPWYSLTFPAGSTLFLYSVLRSAFKTLRAGGVTWRGTFYPLTELRKEATFRP